MRLKLPPQVVRLIILTIAIVGSYAVARQILTPKSFGKYGHYRGDALVEIASREPRYAGAKACDECHSDVTRKLGKDIHRSISCESCHGPHKVHADDPDHNDPLKVSENLCMRCHEFNVARPASQKQIRPEQHYTGKGKCTECHAPHQPNEVP